MTVPSPTATEKTQDNYLDESTSQLPASDKWLHVEPEYPEQFPAWFLKSGVKPRL
jgi:hypothetical protein